MLQEMDTSFRACLWLTVPTTALAVLVTVPSYLIFRIYTAACVQHEHILNAGLAWLFLAMEALMLLSNSSLYMTRLLAISQNDAPHLYKAGNDVPKVDVLITCCREDERIILNVVRAACALDWPVESLRIFLLDDGRSEALHESVQQLRQHYSHLSYSSRSKPEIPDYKAGNLNHGLCVARSNLGGPSPFVAGLDADMIPEPFWLRRLMPHLLDDPQMGMVCPPQHFYNIPFDDPLDQDLSLFYRQRQPCHQALGAADCWGSGYVARRLALDTIGGFPTKSLCEDAACTMMLLGRGWRTAFIDEKVQHGQVPATFAAHLKQRTRWNLGTVQNAVNFRCHFVLKTPDAILTHLSLGQRMAAWSQEFAGLAQWALWLSLLGLPLALLSGYPFVIYSSNWELQWLVRLASLYQIAMGLHCCVCLNFAPYMVAFRAEQNESWMVPYHIITLCRHYLLSHVLGGSRAAFRPSGSINGTTNERDKILRTPFVRRLRVMLFDQLVIIHVLFLMACGIGIILALLRAFVPGAHIGSAFPLLQWLRNSPLDNDSQYTVSTKVRLVYLLTRIGWPPLVWCSTCVGAWVPVWYMLFPPTMKAEDELLAMDEKTIVLYPTEVGRGSNVSSWGRLRDHVTLLVTAYSVFTFVLAWVI